MRAAGQELDPRTGGGTDAPQVPPAPPPARLGAELTAAFRRSGVQAMLAALNARTRYRFTGTYEADPPLLRNRWLYDRENPSLRGAGDINLLDETYCAITLASGAPFASDDAGADPRLVGHAARGTVLSYLGVPIRGPDGRVRGTLCHFDTRPRLIPVGERLVLEWVAAAFGAALIAGAAARPE